MFRRLLIISAAALAVIGIVAGCGDDDSGASNGPTVTTSSLSKEQYVERANEVCKRRNEQLSDEITAYVKKTQKENPDASRSETFTGAAEITLAAFQDTVDSLRGLGAPEGDEDELGELLTEMQRGVDTLEQQLPEETTRLDQANGFFRTLKSAGAMARRYGIGTCALSSE